MSDVDKAEPQGTVKPVGDEEIGVVASENKLHTDLKSRHMQMIAIGK